MHAHIVLAHPEPQSFNGQMAAAASGEFASLGWSVSLTDLYALDFDPCERAGHFNQGEGLERFDVQSAQLKASQAGELPQAVVDEIARLDEADLLILQYPIWWHLPPAMLKGWFDRVLAFGEVYSSKQRFEHGRFAGKKAMLSVTVGTSRETYLHDGRSGDIDLLLWPVNFSLAYVGFTVLEPFVAYGIEGGQRYSDADEIQERLAGRLAEHRDVLRAIDDRNTVPFNKMAQWGTDGRILPNTPLYSPFIRRKKNLELE